MPNGAERRRLSIFEEAEEGLDGRRPGTRIIPATDVQRMYFLENRGVVGTRLAE